MSHKLEIQAIPSRKVQLYCKIEILDRLFQLPATYAHLEQGYSIYLLVLDSKDY